MRMIALLLLWGHVADVGIEAPPKLTADAPTLVATKMCHNLFDAAIAQRLPDRNPGDIRSMVEAGQAYRVMPGRKEGEVWAFPMSRALGVVQVSATCFM